jgi:hypothetical protein
LEEIKFFFSLTEEKRHQDNDYEKKMTKEVGEISENNHQQKTEDYSLS